MWAADGLPAAQAMVSVDKLLAAALGPASYGGTTRRSSWSFGAMACWRSTTASKLMRNKTFRIVE
jgi:hypothetical protein